MHTRLLSLGLAFVFLLSAAGGINQQTVPQTDFNLEDYEYVEDQLLVSFKPSVGKARSNQVLAELGLERVRRVEQINLDVLRLPPGLSVEKALEIFSKRPEVRYAEPNFILSIAGNLEAEIIDQWSLQKIQAQAAWDLIPVEDRDPVLIAVVDTGIDPLTPELSGRLWSNVDEIPGDGLDNDTNGHVDDTWGWDFVNGDNNPMDDQMHGTAVSSVIASSQDGQGIAGVCPWCQVMAVKVMTAEGTGSLDVVASGIIYAANNGAQVINLSLAGSSPLPFLLTGLQDAVDQAWAAGALVVAAAGNSGTSEIMYPAGFANALSVGSTDSNDGYSCFSNYSDGYINVGAPGSAVPFVDIRFGDYRISYGDGTSLAAPHVAGLAGLLLAKDSTLTNQQLWDRIETTSVDLGPEGTDGFFGAGRIDALRAVQGNTSPTFSPHQDYVLSDDATGYAHARKLARSDDGTLHLVWYEQEDGEYKIQYASSTDDGSSWSPRETIFSTPAESYHPAIAVDNEDIYVVFPTLSGASNYQIAFSKKPVSGGSWTYPALLMGGSYNAVRPDIYLDPSTNQLHVVASSFDDANYAYYRSASKDESGLHWSGVVNVDFQLKTRYATVYAYGQTVYIASRITDGFMLGPAYYVGIIRSFDGGATWQDGRVMDSENTDPLNKDMYSAEYGLSMSGYKNTLFLLNEWEGEMHFRRHTVGGNIDNWEGANLAPLDSKWPTVTAAPDGTAWVAYVGAPGNIYARQFKGGAITNFSSTEVLPAASYPNFKYGTNYGKAEWVSTYCDGSPFSVSHTTRVSESNTPPLAFFDSPASAISGTPVSFDAAASYDPDGDPLTYVWNFGDGGTGSGMTPSHTYQNGGTFTVTLTINDGNGGSDTESKTVVVEQTPIETFTLTYTAGTDGSLTGMTTQTVNHGDDGTPVTAVPDTGYHFTDWSDGSTDNPRTDLNVTTDISVTANFAPDTFTLTYTAGTGGSVTGTTTQTVNYGDDGTPVTAVANPGYHFVDWSDGVQTATRTDTNVAADLTVTANFAPDTFTLSYSFGTGGSLTGTTTQTVSYGDSGTPVTAVPDDGYHFVNWSDGSTANPRTDTNITADLTVTAYFAINTYTLTYSNGSGGYLTGDVSQTVSYGGTGTPVTAVPDTGYHFTDWSDGVLTATRTDTNVTADLSVTAYFAINTYTLSYTAGGNGTISGATPQTVDYGADGSQVEAVPDTGYHFVDWSDGSTENPRTDLNVTANVSVTANFAINTYTLNYSPGSGGSLSGNLSQVVDYGTDGTAVTAVANSGYHFVNWSDGSTANPRTDLNVTANVSVTANFAINTYTLSYTAGENGTISGATPQTVDYGADGSQVEAVPDTGYHFVDWSDGSTDNPRTDTNVMANLDVTANFEVDSITQQFIAESEIPGGGTVSGSYTDTHSDDGNVQSITERQSGGKPANRYSYLEHTWVFNVTSGNVVTFYANAWSSVSSDGDSFIFEFSTDDLNYNQMFSVDKTEDVEKTEDDPLLPYQSYILPAATQGTVYIRVTDTDPTPGALDLDTIFIDHLYIRVENLSEPPAVSPPSAPSDLVATATSSSQIDLTWTDNSGNEDGFSIERSPDSSNWAQIASVGANVTDYSDTGLEPDTTYYYRVLSYNTSGNSDYSETASATTFAGSTTYSMHVGELVGSGIPVRSKWEATVTITVHNEYHGALEGVLVTGTWSYGGEATCTTNAVGKCSVINYNLKVSSINFEVTNLALNGYIYLPEANHDPVRNEDGRTFITIFAP